MTDAELAILSLLAEGPAYDHDLSTAIEDRGLRKWTAIGHSSMYYVLDKLEHQGLIERLADRHGHRYQISSAGTGVLQTAVCDLLSTAHAYDRSFELGLANLHVLKPHQIRGALLSRRQDMALKLNKLDGARTSAAGNFQIEALYDHHIRLLAAEIAWLEEFTAAWEAQTPVEPESIVEPSIIPRMKQVILPQDPDSVHKRSTRQQSQPPQPPQSSHPTPPSAHTVPPINRGLPRPDPDRDEDGQ